MVLARGQLLAEPRVTKGAPTEPSEITGMSADAPSGRGRWGGLRGCVPRGNHGAASLAGAAVLPESGDVHHQPRVLALGNVLRSRGIC